MVANKRSFAIIIIAIISIIFVLDQTRREKKGEEDRNNKKERAMPPLSRSINSYVESLFHLTAVLRTR